MRKATILTVDGKTGDIILLSKKTLKELMSSGGMISFCRQRVTQWGSHSSPRFPLVTLMSDIHLLLEKTKSLKYKLKS